MNLTSLDVKFSPEDLGRTITVPAHVSRWRRLLNWVLRKPNVETVTFKIKEVRDSHRVYIERSK